MPRDGAIIFGDPIGKLGMLRVECAKCGPSGKYRLAVLIAKYGRDEKLFTWTDELTADCPRKRASDVNDLCGARCPDLPKVVRGPNFADGLGVLEPGAPADPDQCVNCKPAAGAAIGEGGARKAG